MSTLADAERRVRYHLRDRNPQGQAFTSPEVVHELESNMRLVGGKLLLGEEHVTALVTTAPNVQAYALPGTQEYGQLQFLKNEDDGFIVTIISQVAFENVQAGDKPTHPSVGRPQFAMLRESATQVTEVVFWTVPDAVYRFDGYRSLLPATFFMAGTGVLAALPQNTPIPFDDSGFEALCYTTASELFARMPEADRERLKLADSAADTWNARANDFIAASRRRRIFQKITTGGNRGGRRW
jgi:hypothetical protein